MNASDATVFGACFRIYHSSNVAKYHADCIFSSPSVPVLNVLVFALRSLHCFLPTVCTKSVCFVVGYQEHRLQPIYHAFNGGGHQRGAEAGSVRDQSCKSHILI